MSIECVFVFLCNEGLCHEDVFSMGDEGEEMRRDRSGFVSLSKQQKKEWKCCLLRLLFNSFLVTRPSRHTSFTGTANTGRPARKMEKKASPFFLITMLVPFNPSSHPIDTNREMSFVFVSLSLCTHSLIFCSFVFSFRRRRRRGRRRRRREVFIVLVL